MTRSCSDILQGISRVNALNDASDYIGASTLLNQLRQEARDSKDTSVLIEFYFQKARVHYHMGDYGRALPSIRAALRLSDLSRDLVFHGRLKNLLGLILQQMGRLNDAIEEYMEAYAFRRKFKQFVEIPGSLINLGLAHFLRGNLREAFDQLTRAYEYAVTYKRHDLAFIATLNRVSVSLHLGELKFCASELEAIEKNSRQMIEVARISYRKGYLDLLKLNSSRANTTLARAAKIFKARRDFRYVDICSEYLGLNEYFAGNYKKAKEYYQQVLDMPEPTASAVAQTLRMLTDVHIAEGHWSLAKQTAAKAEVAINKISERIELGALWRAYGHIHAHEGNRDEARAFFTKSIELLRQLGARYELALSHFDAGRSPVFTTTERAEHLRSARTLFVDMDVPKRVVQVDAVIAKHEAEFPAETMTARHSDVPSDRHSRAISSRRSREGGNPAKLSLTLKAPAAPTIIAVSESMKRTVALSDKVKDSDLTILITGETGTGKDLLAEYIHRTSIRAEGPFIITNCATLPEALVESELFGYRRGSYSGAAGDKPGLIESAQGGTFVFDEIGEIPFALQAKLLRIIDTKIMRRLGDVSDTKIDARFIALTNRNLEAMVRDGSFRADLYHRLCQLPLHLLPLRERQEDIVPLAALLLDRNGLHANGDTPQLLAAMQADLVAYEWPGNVRELNAIIMRVAAMLDENGNGDLVRLLKQQLGAQDAEGSERRRLFEALRRHDGNKSKVADELGLPRTTLNSQLKKYNL